MKLMKYDEIIKKKKQFCWKQNEFFFQKNSFNNHPKDKNKNLLLKIILEDKIQGQLNAKGLTF